MSAFGFELCIEDEGWSAQIANLETLSNHIAREIAARLDVPPLEAAVLLTDDAAVAALNLQWRGKPGPTNVLSFPAPEGSGTLGDIALALGVVTAESQAQGKSISDHTAHLLVHGALHLLGYDHQTDDEAEEMEALEAQCLAALGISNPYEDQ